MPIPMSAGPPVPDSENAYRAILAQSQWNYEKDCPSSAAFDDDYFSVELSSRTLPSEIVERKRRQGKTVLFVVQFNCGEARKIGFDTRDERDDVDPDNIAHAHVYNTWYGELGLGGKQRKGKARLLCSLCSKVVF